MSLSSTGRNGRASPSLLPASSWSCQSRLQGVPHADASQNDISSSLYMDVLRSSTVVGPAARLTNQQPVHHAGSDDPRTGRRFQAACRIAGTSRVPKLLKTSCSHASQRAASWGTGPLTHTHRSAFLGDTQASLGGAVRAGKQVDAARHAPGSL